MRASRYIVASCMFPFAHNQFVPLCSLQIRGARMGRIKAIDISWMMLVITVAFILTAWTMIVVVVTLILPHAFHLNTTWPVAALAWVAPILPYLSKRLR
jgi:hypothetical protein